MVDIRKKWLISKKKMVDIRKNGSISEKIIRGPYVTVDGPGKGLLKLSALHLRDDFQQAS